MKQFIKLISWVSLIAVLLLVSSAPATAQDSPIKITLMTDRNQYIQGDPIQIQIRVFNDNYNPTIGSIGPVITREGFFTQDFQRMIVFTGPDGKPIKTNYAMPDHEPGPAYRFKGRDTITAEIIPPDGQSTYVIDDVKQEYNITQTGWYKAQIRVPFVSFSEYATDAAGGLLAYLDDPERKTFNPLASNEIRFEIVPQQPVVESAINVRATLIKITLGWRPSVKVVPVEGMQVNLYRISSIPQDYRPIDFRTYPMIWQYVSPLMSTLTDTDGIAKFEGVDQSGYLILGYYPEGKYFDYLAGRVWENDFRWDMDRPIVTRLVAIQTVYNKPIACRIFHLRGSELWIYQPEFVTWDSSQELYPIVFESEGDWEVTTSVSPPAGFEVDKKSSKLKVANGIQAIQFTITDKKASWKETEVTHKIKHKNKTQTITEKIGVKLDKKLAKEKGVGIYGDAEVPGPFKGGKKVKKDKDKDVGIYSDAEVPGPVEGVEESGKVEDKEKGKVKQRKK